MKQEADSIDTDHFERITTATSTPARTQSALKRRSFIDSRAGVSEADFGTSSLKACKIEDDSSLVDGDGETTFALFASLLDSAAIQGMIMLLLQPLFATIYCLLAFFVKKKRNLNCFLSHVDRLHYCSCKFTLFDLIL